MKTTLSRRDVITASLYTLWRLFQASVVIPASFAGAALLMMTVTGDSPVEATIAEIYHWAETSVRPAPAGGVLVSQCTDQAVGQTKGIPSVVCKSPSFKVVPIDKAVAEASGWLRHMYLTAAVVSAAILVAFRPGRRFFGLQTPAGT
ncbi:hypothetical protein [Cupriavidus basilensis]|uniref:hypothetical protein n=1 Tax=Cupriavidus basilensis TaxID=68895 RepID=UPI000750CD53|nr:hypothetical protein [Cupriavidus basilensis]